MSTTTTNNPTSATTTNLEQMKRLLRDSRFILYIDHHGNLKLEELQRNEFIATCETLPDRIRESFCSESDIERCLPDVVRAAFEIMLARQERENEA